MQPVDLEKAKTAISGSKSAFYEMIHERKKDILRLAYGYMKNENDVLDILGETVYRAFISIRKLKNPEFFNTWLTKIIINCSINALKKRNQIAKSEILCFDEGSNNYIESANDGNEDSIVFKIDIGNAIDKLDIKDKTIIMLKYYEDFTVTQIAEVLACPVGTVKTHLNKALKTLRKEFSQY